MSIAPLLSDAPEGDAGTTELTFTVSLSAPATVPVTVDWAVSGFGDAPADAQDFAGGVLPGGTLTFAPGETTATLIVPVARDVQVEPDEGLQVTLPLPRGASLDPEASSATGIIRNDDQPRVSIAALAADREEGDAGTTDFTFTVTLDGPATDPVRRGVVRGGHRRITRRCAGLPQAERCPPGPSASPPAKPRRSS